MNNSLFQYIKEALKKVVKKEGSQNQEVPYNFNEVKPFTGSLEEDIALIKNAFKNSDDLVIRKLFLPTRPITRAAVIFLESIVNRECLVNSVIYPLQQGIGERTITERGELYKSIETIIEGVLSNNNIYYRKGLQEAVADILLGNGLLLIDSYSGVISTSVGKEPAREYAEPKTERVVRGSQQGFVEDAMVNLSLLRKNLKTPRLVSKKLYIGRESKTELWVVYIDEIADNAIVEELLKRLKRIDVDGIIGSNQIEEYISDAPMNIFNTSFFTERPDRLQGMLLEGRIGMICEGTPFASVVPAVVADYFITTEDYYINSYFATFNRLIRYLSVFVLLFFPAIYIAISTFHQEMIPTRLALTLAGTRAGVPYPAFVEALLMEIAIETLREAGTRLPAYIGQTISIVGALIIGQAAVEAGLVSPAVVIVVATTAIFSFTLPFTNFNLSLRLIRFFNMALAATLGIYGLMTGALIIALNLFSLRSLGVPFMLPFGPISLEDMKDWVLRLPAWRITRRSKHIVKGNNQRKSDNLKPSPPS